MNERSSGEVDWACQSHVATRAVSQMRGVTGVSNRLEVRGTVASEDVGEQIAKAMQRHAERETRSIQISIEDGTVTLTGKVDSYAERQIARGAAWSAPGVRAVIDNLVVG